MSIRAMTWAYEQKLPCVHKFLLVTLGEFADRETNQCFPSQATLAAVCGLTRQHVNKCLADLERDGFIAVEQRTRPSGAATSCCYRVLVSSLPTPPVIVADTPVSQDDATPVSQDDGHYVEPSLFEPRGKKEEAPLRGANEKESADLFATPSETKNGTRGSRLPTNWQPSADECTFAAQCGLDPIGIADRFRDYWLAKPGAGGVKLDWPATWRNWCRSEMERKQRFAPPRPGNNGSGGSKLLAAVRRIDTSAARARMGR